MRTEDDVSVLRGLLLRLIAALVIRRAKDRLLPLSALAARRPLDIGPNRLCRSNSLQVQAQRLARGEIGGLPGLPKSCCDAFRQALTRLLAQFVGGDEHENTMRDALPFLLLPAGFLYRINLFCFLNVTGDTDAGGLRFSDARWHADRLRLRYRTVAAFMESNCARHLLVDDLGA